MDMKTLKYISMMLLLVAVSAGFVSCSDDDDDDNDGGRGGSIVGAWATVNESEYDGGTESYELMTFNSDGTFNQVTLDYYGWDIDKGTYDVGHDEVTMTYSPYEIEQFRFSVKNDRLVIDGDYIYVRKGDSEQAPASSIVGIWLDKEDGGRLVTFNADNTFSDVFVSKDDYDNTVVVELTGTYHANFGNFQMVYDYTGDWEAENWSDATYSIYGETLTIETYLIYHRRSQYTRIY